MITLIDLSSTTAGAAGGTLGVLVLALVEMTPWPARHAQDGLPARRVPGQAGQPAFRAERWPGPGRGDGCGRPVPGPGSRPGPGTGGQVPILGRSASCPDSTVIVRGLAASATGMRMRSTPASYDAWMADVSRLSPRSS